MTDETKELLDIYQRADEELQGLIWRMVILTEKHGMPFMDEMEGPCRASDREAIKEVLRKWEAK